jgi:hypothetical protein
MTRYQPHPLPEDLLGNLLNRTCEFVLTCVFNEEIDLSDILSRSRLKRDMTG